MRFWDSSAIMPLLVDEPMSRFGSAAALLTEFAGRWQEVAATRDFFCFGPSMSYRTSAGQSGCLILMLLRASQEIYLGDCFITWVGRSTDYDLRYRMPRWIFGARDNVKACL